MVLRELCSLVTLALMLSITGAITLLDHAFDACLESPECMEAFDLTPVHHIWERKRFDVGFEQLLKKEEGMDFTLVEDGSSLTAMLYWGICETAEKVGVECKHRVNRKEIDKMLTEMDNMPKCGGVKK
jgi:hypothetical protein